MPPQTAGSNLAGCKKTIKCAFLEKYAVASKVQSSLHNWTVPAKQKAPKHNNSQAREQPKETLVYWTFCVMVDDKTPQRPDSRSKRTRTLYSDRVTGNPVRVGRAFRSES